MRVTELTICSYVNKEFVYIMNLEDSTLAICDYTLWIKSISRTDVDFAGVSRAVHPNVRQQLSGHLKFLFPVMMWIIYFRNASENHDPCLFIFITVHHNQNFSH